MYAEDVDAVMQQAVEAGATVTMEAENMFWGDRFGTVKDPFGHIRSIATRARLVDRDARRGPDRRGDRRAQQGSNGCDERQLSVRANEGRLLRRGRSSILLHDDDASATMRRMAYTWDTAAEIAKRSGR